MCYYLTWPEEKRGQGGGKRGYRARWASRHMIIHLDLDFLSCYTIFTCRIQNSKIAFNLVLRRWMVIGVILLSLIKKNKYLGSRSVESVLYTILTMNTPTWVPQHTSTTVLTYWKPEPEFKGTNICWQKINLRDLVHLHQTSTETRVTRIT